MDTYHIKNGGDDNLDGLSDATAFATWSKAFSVIGQGDTVAFKCGEIYPAISITRQQFETMD